MNTKASQFTVAMSLLGALGGCSGTDDDTSGIEVLDEPAFGVTWDMYREAAVVPDGSGGYIAEWDLFFASEKELREHYEREFGAGGSKLAVFKRNSTGFEPTFSITGGLDIKYCVSNSFSNKSTVVSDVANAFQGWERVMNVRFRYLSSADASCNHNTASVDFAVMPTTLGGLYGCAASKMLWAPLGCPVSGVDRRGVLLLNYGIIGTGDFAEVTAKGLIQHEVGHMLGFRHEHPWAPGGCSEAPTEPSADVTGRRLTDYDQVSVMHYPMGSCNGIEGSDMSISKLDGVGGRSIYGMPAAWYRTVL